VGDNEQRFLGLAIGALLVVVALLIKVEAFYSDLIAAKGDSI
jgi:hypothetical protein